MRIMSRVIKTNQLASLKPVRCFNTKLKPSLLHYKESCLSLGTTTQSLSLTTLLKRREYQNINCSDQ